MGGGAKKKTDKTLHQSVGAEQILPCVPVICCLTHACMVHSTCTSHMRGLLLHILLWIFQGDLTPRYGSAELPFFATGSSRKLCAASLALLVLSMTNAEHFATHKYCIMSELMYCTVLRNVQNVYISYPSSLMMSLFSHLNSGSTVVETAAK